MNTLQQATFELGKSLNRYSKTRKNILDGSFLFARVCPKCKKLVTSRDELYILAETGECASCDHVYGETLEEAAKQSEDNAKLD